MSKKLVALTTAALSLPGMLPKTTNAQSSMPDKFSIDYRFTKYQEQDQPASTTLDGKSVERYSIKVHQLGVVAPVSSLVSLNLLASTESMSGASPWYIVNDNGRPAQVMSGPTPIEEERNDIAFATNFYSEASRIGLGVARSTENDYDSKSLNANASLFLNDKNTTVDFGFSFSDDLITPTQQEGVIRVIEEEKSSESAFISLSQVVNKTFLVGGVLTYSNYKGFLSDPYKQVEVEGVLGPDSRPDTRQQLSLEFNTRKYFIGAAGALHADYRFYDNDWGVTSHTLKLGWHQNINQWQLSPSVRWYDQTAANFHSNFFTAPRADGYYTSDYRLSAFGAVSYQLRLSRNYQFGTFSIAYQNYQSGKGRTSEEPLNPGLVNFDFLTIGFNYKF